MGKKDKEEQKRGRPSVMTDENKAKILELIASTPYGIAKICRLNPELPCERVIWDSLAKDNDFTQLYARAKEQQADLLADDIIDIADRLDDDDELSHEKVAAARLRVDSRKWVAAKLKPKKYGDKTDLTTDGESLNKGFADFLKEVSRK